MVRRHELSAAEWALVAPLLPPQRGRDRPFKDHRTILNGVLWRLKTGVPWRDLPARYEPWETVYSRFACWQRSGLWARLLAQLRQMLDEADSLDWDRWCIDGSYVRAPKAAAGAGKEPGPLAPGETSDHALGRSRGGFGTKLHLATDGPGAAVGHRLESGAGPPAALCKSAAATP